MPDKLKQRWEDTLDFFSRKIAALDLGPLEGLKGQLERLGDFLTWKRWAVIAAALLFICMGGFYLLFGSTPLPKDIDREQKVYVTVREGMNASEIADTLLAHHIIDSRLSFWWQVKSGSLQDKFKAGTYLLHPGMTSEEVLDKLIAGETTTIKFTIPEGFGIKEIAERLSDEGLVDKEEFLRLAKEYYPYGYVEHRANARYAAEGFLFPDTYEIQSDFGAKDIMQMMAKDFDQRLTPALRERAAEMDLSIYELVTLASLVEKEARYEEDRPIIAQVFFKRLKIGMPLQSDTTLQYLLDAPKEDVSIEDTKMDSPYNTYQHYGLPPGPIASPGMAAIEAVLYPADTDYLYFVADRQGHNHYSVNYADHLALVDQVR